MRLINLLCMLFGTNYIICWDKLGRLLWNMCSCAMCDLYFQCYDNLQVYAKEQFSAILSYKRFIIKSLNELTNLGRGPVV